MRTAWFAVVLAVTLLGAAGMAAAPKRVTAWLLLGFSTKVLVRM